MSLFSHWNSNIYIYIFTLPYSVNIEVIKMIFPQNVLYLMLDDLCTTAKHTPTQMILARVSQYCYGRVWQKSLRHQGTKHETLESKKVSTRFRHEKSTFISSVWTLETQVSTACLVDLITRSLTCVYLKKNRRRKRAFLAR